jgi:hypothetical protein
LESEFLEALAILHKFLKQGCCRHLLQAVDLPKSNKGATMKATKMMARKVHVYIKILGAPSSDTSQMSKIVILHH